MNTIYKTIIKIARTPQKPLETVPEMPAAPEEGQEPPSEEEKANIQKQIEEATANNETIQKENEELAKI